MYLLSIILEILFHLRGSKILVYAVLSMNNMIDVGIPYDKHWNGSTLFNNVTRNVEQLRSKLVEGKVNLWFTNAHVILIGGK